MSKPKPCPYCRNNSSVLLAEECPKTKDTLFTVKCKKCCARGPISSDLFYAMEEWDEVSKAMKHHWK
jgi:hypothetical protein